MRDRLEELGESTIVVLVTFTDPASLDAYAANHQLGFPVLLDPDRQAYRAFGLGRGSVLRIWGLRSLRRYLEIFRSHGFSGLTRTDEDTLQLGGDFVVAPDGTLAYGFWGEGPDERPSVDELVDAIRAVSG